MIKIIKYVIIGSALLFVTASRMKVTGSLNDFGLNYRSASESELILQAGFYHWDGFEGSMVHFFAIGLLFLFVLYDYVYRKTTPAFYVLNCFVFSVCLFAFQETFVRILAVILFYFALTIAKKTATPHDT